MLGEFFELGVTSLGGNLALLCLQFHWPFGVRWQARATAQHRLPPNARATALVHGLDPCIRRISRQYGADAKRWRARSYW